MSSPRVLIVGAGPTGLVLAYWLARRGIAFRIVDKASGPGQASRAIAVHARTLEFYRQLGIADEVVGAGIRMDQIHLRLHGRRIASLVLRDMGSGLSPYPFALSYPQDEHERLLVEKLRAVGATVEWGAELTDLRQTTTGVHADLMRGGTRETCDVEYLCGCDGAHSRVRQSLSLGFPGGTYNRLFFVADVRIEGPCQPEPVANLGARGFVLMMPVRSTGMERLIGIVPDELTDKPDLSFEDVRAPSEQLLHLRVAEVNWFSKYQVHHRVAERFGVDCCFIAGDAAHIHSPAGGQGMNTGIGDAVNLAWKLADVLDGRIDPSALATYEPERIAFARVLVATTDKLFQGMAGRGIVSELVRALVVPTLMPLTAYFPSVRRQLFKSLSQIRIKYRQSALSVGQAGEVHGGDRLPWVPSEQADNFAPLESLDWQVHVYGEASEPLREAAAELGLALHVFPWASAAQEARLQRDAMYLVRPDGHVALASAEQNPQALREYAERWELKSAHGSKR